MLAWTRRATFPLDLWSDGRPSGKESQTGARKPGFQPQLAHPCSETLAIPRLCGWRALCPAAQILLSQLGCSPSSQVKAPPRGSRQGRARGMGPGLARSLVIRGCAGRLAGDQRGQLQGKGRAASGCQEGQGQCMPGSSCSEQVLADSAGCSWPVYEQGPALPVHRECSLWEWNLWVQ